MSAPIENAGGESEAGNSSPVETYTGSEDQSSKGNPAWEGLLNDLPAGLHDLVKPHLEKWDRGFQQKSTQLADFQKQYADVDLNRYQTGNKLIEMLDSDPVTLFNKLEAELVASGKLTARQAAAAVQELKNENLNSQDPDSSSYEDPAIKELRLQNESLREQQGKFNEFQQNYQQEQLQNQIGQQLDGEISRLRKEHGRFDEGTVLEFVMAQVSSGQQLNVQAAYDKYSALVNQIRSTPSAGQQAPFVTPSNGGLASSGGPTKESADMTADERMAYFKAKYELSTRG